MAETRKGGSRKRRGRGEGGVHQRADGRWVGSVSMGYRVVGGVRKRARKVVYGTTKAECLERMATARAAAGMEGGTHGGTAAGPSLAEVAAQWLAAVAQSCKETTHESYACVCRDHLPAALAATPVADVRRADLARLHADLLAAGVGSWRRQTLRQCLAGMMRHAVACGYRADDPSAGLRVASAPTPDMTCLTAAQARELVAAVRERASGPFRLALWTGMRIGEVTGLRWRDVPPDFSAVRVERTVSKSWTDGRLIVLPVKTKSSRRTISLPEEGREFLRRLHRRLGPAPDHYVTARPGLAETPHDPGAVRAALRRVRARLAARGTGFPAGLRFHDLRHTHASLLLSAGASVKAVSARLGHSDAAITLKVYAHCMPGDDERLAGMIGEALRL